MRVGVDIADLAAEMYATQSVLASLFRREFAGDANQANASDEGAGGQRIDVSLFDSLLGWLSNMATDPFASAGSLERMGSRHPHIAPYQVFETVDGYAIVACASEAIWYWLCETVLRPDLLEDQRFESNERRVQNRDQLETILTDAFADATVEEVVELLRINDVPVGRIPDVLHAFEDPQVEARGLLQRVSHSTGGVIQFPGSPM